MVLPDYFQAETPFNTLEHLAVTWISDFQYVDDWDVYIWKQCTFCNWQALIWEYEGYDVTFCYCSFSHGWILESKPYIFTHLILCKSVKHMRVYP